MPRLDAGSPLVLHAVPDDLEAAANLAFVAAHLTEYARAGTDRDAAAAVVVGDPNRCADLMAAGVPTVYVHPAGAAPGDSDTVDVAASIVCRQVPSWLARSFPAAARAGRSETRVSALAPPKRFRSAGGGPAVQLTGGRQEPERIVAALRSALRSAPRETDDPVPVLTDLPTVDWEELAHALGEFTFTRVDIADWPRVLRRAGLLVATPTLLSTTFAQAAELPLRLLPAAGRRQSRVRESLMVRTGGAATVPADVWPTGEGRAGELGGAAQIARKIRQLCLAPV